jgi:hypothetical protein
MSRAPGVRFRRELGAAALPRSVLELASEGVTTGQLRGKQWRRTSHGFYVPTPRPNTTTQRILDAVPLVPSGGALSGWAAAFVAGVDRLDGIDSRSMTPLPVLICLARDVGWRKRPGVVATKEPIDTKDLGTIAGVPVTSLVRAAFDGVRRADGLEEAVVFLDACANEGKLDLLDFQRYLAQRSGWRGVERARRAADLADAASRSSWESRLRAHLVVDLGLTTPLVNVPVFRDDGRLLGLPDLLLVEEAVAIEFDGGDHLRRTRHHDDRIREELFEASGVIVTRADCLDLRPTGRAGLDRRILDAVHRGRTRDRALDRWTLVPPTWWLVEVEEPPRLSDHELAAIEDALTARRDAR